MKRKIDHLTKKIAEYKTALDHATTADEIKSATRMLRAYENALIALEEEQ